MRVKVSHFGALFLSIIILMLTNNDLIIFGTNLGTMVQHTGALELLVVPRSLAGLSVALTRPTE